MKKNIFEEVRKHQCLTYETVMQSVAKAAKKVGCSTEQIMAKIGNDLLWFTDYDNVCEQALSSISNFVRYKLGRGHEDCDPLEHRQKCLANGFVLEVHHEPERIWRRITKEGGHTVHLPARKSLVLVKGLAKIY